MKFIAVATVVVLLLQLGLLSMSQKLVARDEIQDPIDAHADAMEEAGLAAAVAGGEDSSVSSQTPHRTPTNPATQVLAWGIDNSDLATMHEKAEAIRAGLAEPTPIDRDVLDALFPNPVEGMQRLINDIKNPETSSSLIASNLLSLEDFVQDIDNANDMHKTNGEPFGDGLHVVLAKLSHKDEDVRRAAAWVIGTLVQMNPEPQKRALSYGAVPPLMALMARNESIPVRAKALYALSALSRSFEPGLDAFVDASGITLLTDLLKDTAEADDSTNQAIVLRRKGTALVNDLVSDRPSLADAFGDAGVCAALVEMLSSHDNKLLDNALEALQTLGPLGSNVSRLREAGASTALTTLRTRIAELAKEDFDMYEIMLARIDAVHAFVG